MAATLSARRDAGGGLVLVSLAVDPTTAAAYVAPGQYVEVKTPAGNGYFVLAGPCGASPWELLVRNAGEAAELLVTAPIGTSVDVSAPLGQGFPVGAAHGRPVIVAVVGSALAVARPILARRIAQGDAASTTVYLGFRRAEDVPLAAEVSGWATAGARVVLCLSRSELEHEEHEAHAHAGRVLANIAREEGWVQRVVARHAAGPAFERRALVVAAGPESMLADMRAFGVEADLEVHTNA